MKRTNTNLTDCSGLRGMWTDSCLDFSRTTLRQKCSCRTITQRLTFGQWESCCTSCCLVRCPSRVIRNLKSLATWSREISTSTTSLSKSILQKLKTSCSVSSWRTSTNALPQNKHMLIHGSRTSNSTTVKQWMIKPLNKWKQLWMVREFRKLYCYIWARIHSRRT